MRFPDVAEFYKPIEGALPAVICDTGFEVLFANRSAYTSPVTLRWLADGRPGLGETEELIGAHFRADTHAIGAFPFRSGGLRYTLLADRVRWEGTCVYVLALARADDTACDGLATELDGRRMLTACFTPRTEREYMPLADGGELTARCFSELCGALPAAKDRLRLKGSCSGVGHISGEPLITCLTALASAFLSAGRGEVAAELVPRKGGFAITICGERDGGSEGALSLAACFPRAMPQAFLAMKLAWECGFEPELSEQDGNKLIVTLNVPVFDVGELGFKASESFYFRFEDCLRSAVELLF